MLKNLFIAAVMAGLAGCDARVPLPAPAPPAKPLAALPPEPTLPPAPAPPPDPTLEGTEAEVSTGEIEAAEAAVAAADQSQASARRFERNMLWLRAIKKGGMSERARAISAVKKLPSDEQEEFEGLRKFYRVEY